MTNKMDEAPVKPGDVLAGKYRVERVLGLGGMGVVVAATHVELHELRALKFMLPEVLENAVAVERFLREARAAARLRTEHVAKVYDIGRLENGAPYMVMEHLEGADLRTLLRKKGPFPAPVVALWAIQICEALTEAHSLGIVHRDLKPANLFLTHRHDGSPCVKVLDFGISKVAAGGEGEMELTKTHEVLGSPLFMSPEQLQSVHSADARADIWSLGVVLYALATARMPFRGEGVTEVITAVISGALLPPSHHRAEIAAGFDDIVLRCLRRDREQRYQTATELATALHALVPAGDAVAARLSSPALFALSRGEGPDSRSPSLVSIRGDSSAGSSSLGVVAKHDGAVALADPTPSPAEHTGASWGNTSSSAKPRRGLRVAIGAGLVLVTGTLLGYLRWAPSPAPEAGAGQDGGSAAAPPGSALASHAVLAAATVAPSPLVVPAPTAVAAPPPPLPSATASAAAPRKAPRRAPSGGSDDGSDPFGNKRK